MYANNYHNDERYRREMIRKMKAIIWLLVILVILALENRIAHIKEISAERRHCDSLHAAQDNQILNVLNLVQP